MNSSRSQALAYPGRHASDKLTTSPDTDSVPISTNLSLKNATNPDEIIPGLTGKNLLEICIHDHRLYKLEHPILEDIAKRICAKELEGPLSYVTAEDRAELIAELRAVLYWIESIYK